MKCNACWKNLEGSAVATTCGHIFCTEDAEKILSSVGATCPLCEQTLSKSKIKTVDMAPTDEWINMVMAGVAPQSSILILLNMLNPDFGMCDIEKDVEVQLSVNKALHFRQKCEQMQAAYSQKMSQIEEAYTATLQQVHSGYQKAMKKTQAMEHEKETMQKDKKEIQEKYTEKQKRKLEEMYDALRKEHELLKRSVTSSTPNNQAVIQRPNPYAFAPTFNAFDDLRHQPSGLSGMPTNSPAGTADFWPPRQEAQPGPFDLPSLPQTLRTQRQASGNSLPRPFSGGSPTMFNTTHHSPFNSSNGAQPSATFRNLLRSPTTRRPQGRPRGL